MAHYIGKPPEEPQPQLDPPVYEPRHAAPISPVNDNPVMTQAQQDQLARDVALFDNL